MPHEDARVDLLLALSHRIQGHVAAAAGAVGLTPSQALLLRRLDEPRPMQELAGALGCDPSNVTGLIDRLARRGLVERRPDPADRRVRRLAVTDRGRGVRAELDRRLAERPPAFDGLDQGAADVLERLLGRALEAPPAGPAGATDADIAAEADAGTGAADGP